MAIKKLQNDHTTPEQSKRLLELGVPKDSANYYYGKGGKLRYIDGTIPYSLLWEIGCTPCWSVGRLIEIYRLCVTVDPLVECPTFSAEHLCELFVVLLEFANDTDVLDLSKLEE